MKTKSNMTSQEFSAVQAQFKQHFGVKVAGRSMYEFGMDHLKARIESSIAANKIHPDLLGEDSDLVTDRTPPMGKIIDKGFLHPGSGIPLGNLSMNSVRKLIPSAANAMPLESLTEDGEEIDEAGIRAMNNLHKKG